MLAATSVWWRVLWAWWRRCGRSSCLKGLVDKWPPGLAARRRLTTCRRPSRRAVSDVRQSLRLREARPRGDWVPLIPRSSDTNRDIFHDQLQQQHVIVHSSTLPAHHRHSHHTAHVSQNVPPLTCYNLDIYDSITTIFRRRVTKKARNQMMLSSASALPCEIGNPRQRTSTLCVQHSPTSAALSTSFLPIHAPPTARAERIDYKI